MQNPSVVRICSAQIASIWEEPEKTLQKADMFIQHAAISGADLICFPEQFATGWDPESCRNIQDVNGQIVSALKKSARKNRISIIGSFRENSEPHPRNTAVVIGNDGRVITTYSKIHLFSPGNEHTGFVPGDKLGLFSLGPLTCGIAICYDLRFPELFGLYAQKGAHLVLVPAAWPAQRVKHWELFITARAAENQLYVVGVNTTGTTPVDTYPGNSLSADPHGAIVSRANEAEQLIFTDIDPALVIRVRHHFPVEKDRRDNLYRSLSC